MEEWSIREKIALITIFAHTGY